MGQAKRLPAHRQAQGCGTVQSCLHAPRRRLAAATESATVPKPNYSFEKRQRELAKKQKKADKLAEKSARKEHGQEAADPTAPPEPDSAQAPAAPPAV
jgi:hypothetical protein